MDLSCPRCESPQTEILTISHRNDPLCYCFTCQLFWRPFGVEAFDTSCKKPH